MASAFKPNSFKRGIADGGPQVGFWLSLASETATEIAAGAGFDWLLIDMEHTPNELPHVVRHMRAAVGGTAEPIVRVPWNDFVLVKRLLDMGARSLFFPTIQSVEEARAAVAATRYPQDGGIRGFSGISRASGYGRRPRYLQQYAEDICVIVQIETRKGLAAIAQIAAVEGVDGVFLGPGDLSSDMGFIGQAGAPAVRAAVMDGLRSVRAQHTAAGMITSSVAEAKELFAAGFAFVSVGSDTGVLVRQTNELADAFASRSKSVLS